MSTNNTTGGNKNIKEEIANFTVNGKNYLGFFYYDENIKDKRPGIIVVPEWWGLNDYPKNRARQLTSLGYVALVIDMYGDGKLGANPQEAQTLATPYYQDVSLTKLHIDAAIDKIKSFPQTDTAKIAAIGYCFGGFVVLNAAKLGARLKGVVSFHGSLGGPAPKRDVIKANLLICHGGADEFANPDVEQTKKQLDSVNADYKFIIYPGAKHAFSNPAATENGKKFNMPIKYNAEADVASWKDMKEFFEELF
jgi:dienelactone hydrolase